MPYTQPTLTALTTIIRRDLRDTAASSTAQVFVDAQIADFINLGLAELNLERPTETLIEAPGDIAAPATIDDLDGLDLTMIFAVELLNTTTDGRNYIAAHEEGVSWLNGWRYFAGKFEVPEGIKDIIENGWADANITVRIYGYRDREAVSTGAPTAAVELEDLQDEAALRCFCRLQGLRALVEDRALFAQWQQQTNNADISPTQLNNMKSEAWREWERMIARIRRMPRLSL